MTKLFLTAAAAAALVVSGPLAAQQRSNGQQTREQARQNSQGPANANPRGVERSNENSVLNGTGGSQQERMNQRRRNSQGSSNANERARERANQNSAIANVQPGMMVHDRNNRMIGRVTDVRRSSTGVIIAIVVALTVQINGSNTITLPTGSFTVVAGVVIVTTITAR
ncbi:MAG TPA: hypothetical protein VEZ41_14080 [Allosphingosinicella sp.]|jgi:hypothetical protein|nr:hypothetical protein [Allosphingosinicella sp.]